MKCSECQAELSDGANFCIRCGQELSLKKKLPMSSLLPHAERKRVTALFSDLSGYTAITEMLDPEEVKEITSIIFDGIRGVVRKYQGFIERFTGDGVLSLFGVPKAHEDDPIRAIRAAMEIHGFVDSLSPRYKQKVGKILAMHSGVNTGLVVTADVEPEKGTPGVTGDAINVAAKLRDLAGAHEILVGPDTYKACKSYCTYQSLKPVKIKGKSEIIPIYKVISVKAVAVRARQEMQIFSEMLGRDQELAKLELHVLKAVKGQGSVVNVFGEPGIGKSRLLAELRQRKVIKKVRFLEGRSISIGRGLSFHPIIDLFKQWSQIMEDDSPTEASKKLETVVRSVCGDEVGEVFPFVATMMGMRLSGKYSQRIKGIEGEALEKLIMKNVRELLIRSTELIPLVIVMEDLHWADATSLTLLKSLFRIAQNHRIVFINVFRPGYWQEEDKNVETLPEWLPEIEFAEIAIKPLDRQMGEALFDSMLQVKGLGHSMKQLIVDRAGGNPFFMEEILRSLIDEGAIARTNGRFEATEKIDHQQIPSTINDVLVTRIDLLDDRTRELIKIASVIGRSFFYRILKEVATSIDEVDERLAYLKDAQFIRDRMRMEELEYLFKHALAQKIAYKSILIQDRKRLHRKVAQSIEKVFQERLQEFYGMLAFHYSKTDEPEKTEEYMTKAGEEALRSAASYEALHYFQEALKLYLAKYGNDVDSEKIIHFKKNIALAFFNRAQWSEAVEYFDKVLERWGTAVPKAGSVGTIKLIWNLLMMIKAVYWRLPKSRKIPGERDIEGFKLYYKEGLALPYVDHSRFFMGVLVLFRRTMKFDLFKIPELSTYWLAVSTTFTVSALSFRLSNRLMDMSERYRVEENIGSQMNYVCMSTMIHHCQGNWGKILDLDEELLNAALRNGDRQHVSTYLWFYGLVKGEQGEFGELIKAVDILDDIGEMYDYDQVISNASGLKANYFIQKRNTHEALSESEQGILYAREKGNEIDEIMFLGLKAEVKLLAGDMEEALDMISQASALNRMQASVMPLYIAPYVTARFFADVETLKRAISSRNPSDVKHFQKNAHLSGIAAVRNSRKYAPYRTKILRVMGLYYWLTGKQSKALKWWSKAMEEGKRLGARPDLSRTYFEVGKRLLEPESRHKKLNGIDANGYLEKASTIFRELNLQRDLDEKDE